MYYRPSDGRALLLSPRTASRSIAQVAQAHGFVQVAGHHEVDVETLAQAEHVFVSVRHHLDALASWYTSVSHLQDNFPSLRAWFWDWYERDVLGGRTDAMAVYVRPGRLYPMLDHATGLIRYEQIEQDLAAALDVDQVELPRVTDPTSTRQRAPWQDFYSAESAWGIGRVFRGEMVGLGYGGEE